MPQGVRADLLVQPGTPGDASHDPAGAMAVHALPVGTAENRPVKALADSQVDCPCGAWGERDGDDLAALAQHGEGAVPALDPERNDVRADGLGDT